MGKREAKNVMGVAREEREEIERKGLKGGCPLQVLVCPLLVIIIVSFK